MSDARNPPDVGKRAVQLPKRPTDHALSNMHMKFRRDNGSLLKKIVHGKIRKHGLPPPLRPRTLHLAEARFVVRSRQLRPEQRDRAVSLYNKLRTLRLASPAPHLQSQDVCVAEPGTIALEYPQNCSWLLMKRIHRGEDRRMPILTGHEVRTLRRILTRDVAMLYDAHIPYRFDISVMSIARIPSRSMQGLIYKPFIDTFDLDLDPQDESIQWAVLKESTIKSIEAQFAVIEAFVECSSGQHMELRADLEPDAAIDVLEALETSSPPPELSNFLIRYVSRYSTKLGRFVAHHALRYLFGLPRRTTAPCPFHICTLDHYDTVAHVLRLADSSAATGSLKQGQLLADRVALLAVYTALLVHIHAKTIENGASIKILALEENDMVEMYTGIQEPQRVTNARQRLAEAIDALDGIGGTLSTGTRWLLQGMTSPPSSPQFVESSCIFWGI
ncbi:hypothetical protein F5B21DRAFT_61320 [Xylaria acuta]|nr:hypothetical protein F5B21DRAFT_61320 [Xylaria acuta]